MDNGNIIESKDFWQSLSDPIPSNAASQKVHGEPIEAQGKTLIPVAEVTYNVGGNFVGEQNDGDEPTKDKMNHKKESKAKVNTGGKISPVGVWEIKKDETRFIPVKKGSNFTNVLIAGVVIGLLIRKIF